MLTASELISLFQNGILTRDEVRQILEPNMRNGAKVIADKYMKDFGNPGNQSPASLGHPPALEDVVTAAGGQMGHQAPPKSKEGPSDYIPAKVGVETEKPMGGPQGPTEIRMRIPLAGQGMPVSGATGPTRPYVDISVPFSMLAGPGGYQTSTMMDQSIRQQLRAVVGDVPDHVLRQITKQIEEAARVYLEQQPGYSKGVIKDGELYQMP